MTRLFAAAAVAAVLATASPAAATTVFSDNFSDGSAADWTFFTDFTSFPGVNDTQGIRVTDGVMEVFLDVDEFPRHDTVGARVAQASHGITLTQAGDYTLTLDAGSKACDGCVISYDVIFDGVLKERASTNSLVSRSFNLTALALGPHTLTLGMHTTGLNNGLFQARFDNVALDSVQPIPGSAPEPAAWALMILGFGGVGAAMRRRTAPA